MLLLWRKAEGLVWGVCDHECTAEQTSMLHVRAAEVAAGLLKAGALGGRDAWVRNEPLAGER